MNKNLVLDQWRCLIRGCLLWPMLSLGKTWLVFALLHFVLQGQICLLFQVSLDFLLLHSSPLCWKRHLFLVLFLEGLEVFIELFNFSFCSITGWSIYLNYCDTELMMFYLRGAPLARKGKLLMSTVCPPLLERLTRKWGVLGKDPLLSS